MHALTFSAILLALWLSYNQIKRLRSPLSSVPGPWYTKWTSTFLTYQWLRGRRAQYVQELHEQYGTSTLSCSNPLLRSQNPTGNVARLSPHIVDFSSISAAKRIHAFTRPLLKAKMYDIFKNSNGARSTFDVRDPEAHARHRRLLTSAMSEASLKTVESVVHERAALAVQRIGEETKKEGSADVMKWWMFFSTDVIGELTFGDSFRMLEQGKV
jgi:cytochrome P450